MERSQLHIHEQEHVACYNTDARTPVSPPTQAPHTIDTALLRELQQHFTVLHTAAYAGEGWAVSLLRDKARYTSCCRSLFAVGLLCKHVDFDSVRCTLYCFHG